MSGFREQGCLRTALSLIYFCGCVSYQKELNWEWEHKYAKMGMGIGRVHVTMGMATFSFVPKFPYGYDYG